MGRRIRRLWTQALEGDAEAYRKLGWFYQSKFGGCDKNLSRLCLEKAAELGDEKAFLLLHRLYSRGKQVIDDETYQQMWDEYQQTDDEKERKRLKQYLLLGTREQRLRAKQNCGR